MFPLALLLLNIIAMIEEQKHQMRAFNMMWVATNSKQHKLLAPLEDVYFKRVGAEQTYDSAVDFHKSESEKPIVFARCWTDDCFNKVRA